ncbi:dihydroceramidase [Coccidioides immitis RS]|uniref:Dihydroceramidase n=2 Tax=Coccidioides immitis TaxID=5501 RepID=A0A0E1S1D9_COCIM|nr:dihydroceramidase [Coccidioides immitis RS]EAS29957.2 dihydroceramidase [Coccidioides immitis RS]KMU92016.1 hypothetical protein CIHG_09788 [Coccidioides immitis H538.4]
MSVHIISSPGKPPVWGPQTSKMNFCEEDYHFTGYVGEFINTLTSLSYVFLGCYALYRQRSRENETQLTHYLSYISLVIVGIGSAAYHATLKYPLQLVDDLSMLLGAGIMFHHVLTINRGTGDRIRLFLLITIVLSLAVWAHIKTGDSALHQIVFGSMVVTVGFRTFKLLKAMISSRNMRSKLRRLATRGYLILIVAYGLWLIDVFACQHLRALRHAIGLPLAWLFELHGWWHILTATGVYIYMLLGEYLQPAYRDQESGGNDGWISILKGPSNVKPKESRTNGCIKKLS